MADPKEAAVFAAAVIVLISIPAASQNVEITDKNRLSGEIASKFSDHFKVEFDPGKIFLRGIDNEAKFEMNESFKEKEILFQTHKGSIRKTISNDSIVKVTQTPYGKFREGVENGENISEFDGGEREKAEEIKSELESRMEERSEKALDKKRVVMSRLLPDIELSVEKTQEYEHFNLTNNENREISLEDWYIHSEGSNEDTLNLDRTISPDETLTFYSGEREEVNGAEDAIYDTGLTIYSNDGKVSLFNENDKMVDGYKY